MESTGPSTSQSSLDVNYHPHSVPLKSTQQSRMAWAGCAAHCMLRTALKSTEVKQDRKCEPEHVLLFLCNPLMVFRSSLAKKFLVDPAVCLTLCRLQHSCMRRRWSLRLTQGICPSEVLSSPSASLLSPVSSKAFPGGSGGKESACHARDVGLIPESGRPPGEGIGYPLQYSWASLVAQLVKNPPPMRET